MVLTYPAQPAGISAIHQHWCVAADQRVLGCDIETSLYLLCILIRNSQKRSEDRAPSLVISISPDQYPTNPFPLWRALTRSCPVCPSQAEATSWHSSSACNVSVSSHAKSFERRGAQAAMCTTNKLEFWIELASVLQNKTMHPMFWWFNNPSEWWVAIEGTGAYVISPDAYPTNPLLTRSGQVCPSLAEATCWHSSSTCNQGQLASIGQATIMMCTNKTQAFFIEPTFTQSS